MKSLAPPEQIIGSSIVANFEVVGGKPELRREAKLFFPRLAAIPASVARTARRVKLAAEAGRSSA